MVSHFLLNTITLLSLIKLFNSVQRPVNITNSIWKTVDHIFKPLQVLRLQTNGFLWSNPCWNYSTYKFLFIFCYFQSLEQLHFKNIFAAKYTCSLQYQYYFSPLFALQLSQFFFFVSGGCCKGEGLWLISLVSLHFVKNRFIQLL